MANKWYYNSSIGAVDQKDDWIGWVDLKSGIGWHGPFDSRQNALDFYAQNKSKNPGWQQPTGFVGTIINGARDTAKIPDKVGQAVEDAKKAVTDPLGKFNLGGWFLRVGEILIGLVLIGVGVAKLTGTANIVSQVARVKL